MSPKWNIEIKKIKAVCPACHKGKLSAGWANGQPLFYHCPKCTTHFSATHLFEDRSDGGRDLVDLAISDKDGKTHEIARARVAKM
jgi:uncharacterized protein (DUF983 family)